MDPLLENGENPLAAGDRAVVLGGDYAGTAVTVIGRDIRSSYALGIPVIRVECVDCGDALVAPDGNLERSVYQNEEITNV